MNRLAFVSLVLHTMTENKTTLELHEQEGLREIIEDSLLELQEKAATA